MKTKLLLFILLINCIAFFTAAQVTFQKRYGTPSTYEGAYNCIQSSDGGYVIAGVTSVAGNNVLDIYLIKTDSAGVMQWNKIFSSPGEDYTYDVLQTPDNGYILAGSTLDTSTGYRDILLLKTDTQGNLAWVKSIGGPFHDEAYSVKSTYDGGFILAGFTQNFISLTSDYAYLVKTDSSGNVLWEHSYGGGVGASAYSVIQTADSGYIIAGTSYELAGGWEGRLIKTDKNGLFLWSKTYGNTEYDYFVDVKQTSDGGLILTGRCDSLNPVRPSIYLLRMDIQGNLLWVKNYDGYLDERPYSVDQSSDGGYFISGLTRSFGVQGFTDMFLLKTNDTGSIAWAKIYGTVESSTGTYARQVADNGYILSGSIFEPGNESEIFFVKTDSSGNTNCNDSTVTFTETSVTLTTNTVIPNSYSGATVLTLSFSVSDTAIENIYCLSLGMAEMSGLNFQIFPNPVTENFTINFDEPQEHLEIKIFNSMGELVHIEKNLRGNKFRTRLPGLAEGIYVVQVTNSKDFFSRKIIVVNL